MNFKLTMVLVIVLAGLASLMFFWPKKGETPALGDFGTALLNPAPAGLKTVEYWRDGEEQVGFAKAGNLWEMTFPVKAAANSEDVENGARVLTGLMYKEKTEPGSSETVTAESTGTEKPSNVLKFTDDSGKSYTLGLGKTTVGGEQIYATLNGEKTIYLLENNPVKSWDKDAGEFRNRLVSTMAGDRIVGLTVKHADQTVVLAKGSDGKWVIASPIQARADGAVAEEIVNVMKSVQATGFDDIGRDLAGLNAPVVAVTADVDDAGKQSRVTLEFGYYKDPTSKLNVYASLAGSGDVFTMSASVFNKLNKELNDLRDPAVMPVDVAGATQVSVEPAQFSVERSVAVMKEGDGWVMPSFINHHKAGSVEVLNLLEGIRDLRAIKFVDAVGDLKSIGLDPPAVRIVITLPGKKEPETLLIGKAETADKVTPVMRKGELTVYLVQSGDIEKLLPTAEGMRDKTVDALASDNIRGFAIAGKEAAGGGVTLERAGSAWKMKTGGKSVAADDSAVTSLLSDFTPLMAQRYLAAAGDVQGKGHLAATVTVTGVVGGATTGPATTGPVAALAEITYLHTLSLYKNDEGKWAAVWDGGKEPWVFEPTADLVRQVTTGVYAVQPAATMPAGMPVIPGQ